MTTKTQTIADGAPAWAMPGMKVAYFSGYGGGSSYQERTVSRHTRTMIFLAPVSDSSYSTERGFKLQGKTWTEHGKTTYAATIAELGGERTTRTDRDNTIAQARADAHRAAQQFTSRGRWAGAEDAEKLREALDTFTRTLNAAGDTK